MSLNLVSNIAFKELTREVEQQVGSDFHSLPCDWL